MGRSRCIRSQGFTPSFGVFYAVRTLRVTACLFWFAEPAEELYASVRALEGLADRLACVRGRWEGFPVPEVDTSTQELEAVRDAARDAGLDLSVKARDTFVGEIAQRNYVLQMGLQDADWIYLMDGDERIVSIGDDTRDRLENQSQPVGTLEFHTLVGPEQPLTQWEIPGVTSEQRRLFRANPKLRFERHHWWLVDDEFAYWGEVRGKQFAPANKLDVRVEHRTCVRTPERWKMKREFAAVRDPADKARGYEY